MRFVDLNKTHRICFAAVAAVVSLVALASAAAAGRSGFVGRVQSSRPSLFLSARKLVAAPRHKVALVRVVGINNRGEIVGDLTKNGSQHGYVWQNGSARLLGSATVAINERGQILGYAKYSPFHPVLWENGTRSSIDLDQVYALNDGGQVLGERGASLALWTNGQVSLLPFVADWPVAMNDRGQVVGETAAGRAAEWQDGTLTDLGPGDPIAINDRGEILEDRNGDVLVWQNGIATDLGPGNGIAINERGDVIWADTQGSNDAFVRRDGTTTDLGGVHPVAISNRGQVVTSTYDSPVSYWVWPDADLLPYSQDDARVVGINDHNQIAGTVCSPTCDPNRGIKKEHGVLWTLEGNTVKTQRLGIRQFRRALGT